MDETQFGKGAADRPEDYFGPRAWRHEEIAGATIPASWIEKSLATGFDSYPKKNQRSTSSCTTQALAKQLSVDELSENGAYRELAARSIYPYVVLPGGGSNAITATRLAIKQGMTLESLLPPALTEPGMITDTDYIKDAKIIAQVYAPDSEIECATDFETIASIFQTFKSQGIKKVITASVIGRNNGTWNSAFPKPPLSTDQGLWYHRVSITDFGLISGKKFLAIDNSWGDDIGNHGQQFLDESYQAALYGGIYTLNKPDDWQDLVKTTPPPTYTWNQDLARGASGPDVLALQKALQSLGMFPVSTVVAPTGSFFGITQKGVELFQSAFGLPVTGKVDALTRAKLNDIF